MGVVVKSLAGCHGNIIMVCKLMSLQCKNTIKIIILVVKKSIKIFVSDHELGAVGYKSSSVPNSKVGFSTSAETTLFFLGVCK